MNNMNPKTYIFANVRTSVLLVNNFGFGCYDIWTDFISDDLLGRALNVIIIVFGLPQNHVTMHDFYHVCSTTSGVITIKPPYTVLMCCYWLHSYLSR